MHHVRIGARQHLRYVDEGSVCSELSGSDLSGYRRKVAHTHQLGSFTTLKKLEVLLADASGANNGDSKSALARKWREIGHASTIDLLKANLSMMIVSPRRYLPFP